jgi:hypothetical protein
MFEQGFRFEQTLASFAECPDCCALVLSYAPSEVAPAIHGDEELWELACDRCGAVFFVPEDELLVRSVPVSWLLANPNLAN